MEPPGGGGRGEGGGDGDIVAVIAVPGRVRRADRDPCRSLSVDRIRNSLGFARELSSGSGPDILVAGTVDQP